MSSEGAVTLPISETSYFRASRCLASTPLFHCGTAVDCTMEGAVIKIISSSTKPKMGDTPLRSFGKLFLLPGFPAGIFTDELRSGLLIFADIGFIFEHLNFAIPLLRKRCKEAREMPSAHCPDVVLFKNECFSLREVFSLPLTS